MCCRDSLENYSSTYSRHQEAMFLNGDTVSGVITVLTVQLTWSTDVSCRERSGTSTYSRLGGPA